MSESSAENTTVVSGAEAVTTSESPSGSLLTGGAPATETTKIVEDGAWDWAEGVPGTGQPPEGWDQKKFKFAGDQIKAYPELQSWAHKQMGEGFGSPKGDYHVTIEDSLHQYGIKEINHDDPAVKDILSMAREFNFSTAAVDKIFNMLGHLVGMESSVINAQAEKFSVDQKKIMKEENLDSQVITQWLENHMSPDTYSELKNTGIDSAFMMKVFNELINNQTVSQPQTNSTVEAPFQRADLRKMLSEASDASQLDHVNKLYNQYYGNP